MEGVRDFPGSTLTSRIADARRLAFNSPKVQCVVAKWDSESLIRDYCLLACNVRPTLPTQVVFCGHLGPKWPLKIFFRDSFLKKVATRAKRA